MQFLLGTRRSTWTTDCTSWIICPLIREPYIYKNKKKTKDETGWWSHYSDFVDCAPWTCRNIRSRVWCDLCLLLMLLNWSRVITGKKLTVYQGIMCFVLFPPPQGLLYHSFFSIFFIFFSCCPSLFLLTIPTVSIRWHTNICLTEKGNALT